MQKLKMKIKKKNLKNAVIFAKPKNATFPV